MAKYSSKDISISVNGVDVTPFLTSMSAAKLQAVLEDATAFGSTWAQSLSTGIKKFDDITFGGFYDDASSPGSPTEDGTDAVFVAVGTTVPVVITWGGSKTTTLTCIVKEYDRQATVNQMTKISAVLTVTGSVAEA